MSIASSVLARPRRGRLYIVIGAVLAVLAFATAAGIASLPLIQGTTTGVKVVVASHDIQARTVIQDSDLTLASINPTPPQSFTAVNKVAGKGARVDIPAGMPISSNLVAPSGDLVSSSDVAYLPIPKGWVAVTVPTSEQVGVGGYVQVGDRITMLATIGVGLVVFGTVRSQQAASRQESVRASYRTLADVREQLRRRFDPTGTPTWIASDDRTSKLQRDLVSADLELRPYEFRLIQAGVALVLAVVGLLRFGIGAEFLVLAVIGYVVPSLYLRNRRGPRLREFDAALPRTMELMANSMKAGQSVAQSLSAVTDNADPPVSDEFALARREIELGASVDSALNNMVKRIGSNDLRLMVMGITIQRSVGGDLPAILTTLADTMRQREEMRAEILAATAQSRASALIITLLPIAAALLLYFFVQDYFRPMLTNPIGWVMLVFAGFLLFIGNVIIRRLTAIA